MRISRIAAIVGLVVLGVGVAFYLVTRTTAPHGAIDLIEQFPEAEKRTQMPSLHQGFAIQDVTVNGETKPCIFAHPASRIIWRIVVPEDAVLETAYAIREDAWTVEGDGATFRIGVSDGQVYREFVKQWVDPRHRESDRRWYSAAVDLGPYAGRHVEIIFNTDPNWNAVHDAAVWGAPRIMPRQAAGRR
jgi:hypothetical protein